MVASLYVIYSFIFDFKRWWSIWACMYQWWIIRLCKWHYWTWLVEYSRCVMSVLRNTVTLYLESLHCKVTLITASIFIHLIMCPDGTKITNNSHKYQALIQYKGVKMSSCQFRKFHCWNKIVVRSLHLHSGISHTSKMTLLYWIKVWILKKTMNVDHIAIEYCPFSVIRDKSLLCQIMCWHWNGYKQFKAMMTTTMRHLQVISQVSSHGQFRICPGRLKPWLPV